MFSIIIPIYNVQDYLKDCVNSIIKQSQNIDLEILLVDDGSTDKSGEIAKDFSNQFPTLIKYFLKENGGLSDARNYAIKYATKKYLFFIDSDDYLSDRALPILRNVITNSYPDLIIFDYKKKWENHEKHVELRDINGGIINGKEYLMMNPAAWNKVIKRDLYLQNQVSFPKGLWYEDRATTGNYVSFCKRIYYCKEALYYYRQRNNSIMNQEYFNPKMLDIITAMKMFDQQVDDKLYFYEKEYLFISNLVFQNSLRLLPLKRYQEMKESCTYLNNRYPYWKKNTYFKQCSKGYQIICILISYHLYKIAGILIKLRMRGN